MSKTKARYDCYDNTMQILCYFEVYSSCGAFAQIRDTEKFDFIRPQAS